MTRLTQKKLIELIVVIVAFSFMVGCETPNSVATTHTESGSYITIINEIYNECMANNDIDGAENVLETQTYLSAFYCDIVNYDDVKNRDYNNIQYDIGDLQLAVAAYNEYNEESEMDVEVDWICHYNFCTQEQRNAIDAYVYWFNYCQNGHGKGPINIYREDVFGPKYDEMKNKYGITNTIVYDNLTPAQFKEVQNYMADPENYQVDTSLWE